ncbi:MAG: VIT domain-containing protein, partial [Pseudomonadota bacterium]
MDTYDTADSDEHPLLSRLIKVGLFLLAQGVAVMLVAFIALLVSFGTSLSATTEQASLLQPGDARSGTLLLKEDGAYAEAVRLGTDVDITVSGPTLRARVTQVFRNTSKDWVEATYVYPLATGGAVDTLKMVVGDRVIIGNIKERQQARVIYEEARRTGRKAALTEQERPNIFTNSVANIGPGETVLVQIEYQEPVHQSGREYSLRLPLVVGPRYNPAPIVQSVDFRKDGSGWGAATSDPVPD